MPTKEGGRGEGLMKIACRQDTVETHRHTHHSAKGGATGEVTAGGYRKENEALKQLALRGQTQHGMRGGQLIRSDIWTGDYHAE